MTKAYEDQIICGEGYGPGGVAVIVTCSAPSPALTAAIRHAFAAHGAHSGAIGSVAYLFNRVGVLEFAPPVLVDRAMAYECGAEDVQPAEGGVLRVYTDPAELSDVRTRLAQRGATAARAQITQRAATQVALEEPQRAQLHALLTTLGDIAGVTHVYSNAEVPQSLA